MFLYPRHDKKPELCHSECIYVNKDFIKWIGYYDGLKRYFFVLDRQTRAVKFWFLSVENKIKPEWVFVRTYEKVILYKLTPLEKSLGCVPDDIYVKSKKYHAFGKCVSNYDNQLILNLEDMYDNCHQPAKYCYIYAKLEDDLCCKEDKKDNKYTEGSTEEYIKDFVEHEPVFQIIKRTKNMEI